MNIIKKKIKDLNPAVYNPRKDLKPTDEEFINIKNSVEKFGYIDPIIINKDNTIIGGHQRFKVLKELGYKDIDVVEVDLNKEEEKILNITLNKTGGDWDFEALELLLKDINTEDINKYGLKWDELDQLKEELEEDKEIIEDEAPDVDETKEPKAKLGDIYQLGNHRLMCGDSTKKEDVEKLMNGNKADMVFTDPPYGMNLDTDYSKMSGNGRKGKKYSKVIGDNEDFKDVLITSIFDNFDYCDEIFLWGIDYYIDLIKNFKNGSLIVWDKTLQTNGDAGYNSEFELLWSKTPHKKEVIHFNWFRYFGLSSQDIKTREHPTQKPLQVISPFISKYSDINNNVLDLFGGSGSTLIACEQLNRNCFMMELDPKYIDVIIERWENFTGKKAVLLNGQDKE